MHRSILCSSRIWGRFALILGLCLFPGVSQVEAEQRLVQRCYQHNVEVPDTYGAFTKKIEKWIATCVLSRTGGAHREAGLVQDNQSLDDAWEQLREWEITTATILADYRWSEERVEEIMFSVSSFEFEGDVIVAEGRRYAPIEALCHAWGVVKDLQSDGHTSYDGVELRHLACLARTGCDASVDMRVIWPDVFYTNQDFFMRGEMSIEELARDYRLMWRLSDSDDPDERYMRKLVFTGSSLEAVMDYLRIRANQDGNSFNRNLLALSRWIRARSGENSIYQCYAMGD